MTTALLLLALLGAALVLTALVRDLRRAPARRIPCSQVCDEFTPRWAGGGTGRWSV